MSKTEWQIYLLRPYLEELQTANEGYLSLLVLACQKSKSLNSLKAKLHLNFTDGGFQLQVAVALWLMGLEGQQRSRGAAWRNILEHICKAVIQFSAQRVQA